MHGYASVLGGMYDNAPHGAICARLLPFVFERNVKVLQKQLSEQSCSMSDPVAMNAVVKLSRYQEVAQMITGRLDATTEDGVNWLHALLRDIDIPPLSALCQGVSEKDYDDIVSSTASASSTKGNSVALSSEDLREILIAAM